ncbi:MAG: hypothetical protein EBR20_09735, partial [Bacteroidetes bacterium]|nr:hypothetical protein [Bacteroidota bacterium]
DGTDIVRNIQILRFADGDLVIDEASNSAVTSGGIGLGESFLASIPLRAHGSNGGGNDNDFTQITLPAAVGPNTAIRISFEGFPSNDSTQYGLDLNFRNPNTNERLVFEDVNNGNTQSSFYLTQGQATSWIVRPSFYEGSQQPFTGGLTQRLNLQVNGSAREDGPLLGDLFPYAVRVDVVTLGTADDDELSGGVGITYIDALEGNDVVTGSDLSEEIVGGFGDDTLQGNGGDDVLTDRYGINVLDGGAGDDTFDLSGALAPEGSIDGGEGTDTLRISGDVSFSNLDVTNVERLDGSGRELTLDPSALAALGISRIDNATLAVDPNSSGSELDVSGFAGDVDLRGSNQGDVLTGNDGANRIYTRGAQHWQGNGRGEDVIVAGGGDDRIVLQTGGNWTDSFSAVNQDTRTYLLKGSFDGGAGADTLELDFRNHFNHAWNEWSGNENSGSWSLDLSQLSLTGVERIRFVVGEDFSSNRVQSAPTELGLTLAQLSSVTTLEGIDRVFILGGGAIDSALFDAKGISSWRLGDDANYTITGDGGSD